LASRFLARLSLQIAQDNDDSILVRQPAQFLVKEPSQICPKLFRHGFCLGHVDYLPLSRPPSGGCPSGLQCRLVSHPVEPIGHHLPRHDRGRLADEDKEGRLKGVLGVVMAEKTAADSPDHGAVALHQSREGSVVPLLDEPLQECSIAKSRPISPKHSLAKVLDDPARLVDRHVAPLAVSSPAL
jgi:hypothetical protein